MAYRLVGASACADRITDSLVAIAMESEERNLDISAGLLEASELFCSLKPDTALYRNLTAKLSRAGASNDSSHVRRAGQALAAYRHTAQQAVVLNAESLLQDAETLLVHDYSSTVLRIVRGLGAKRPRRIVVTAGEPLGQGGRIAHAASAAGHNVTFTPDMSVARVIDGVDAFVTGVESFYSDGSLANTVGTRMLALLCGEAGVQVIAPTELLKYDNDRPTVTDSDLEARLLHPWPRDEVESREHWDIVKFVLERVPANLVTSYVTEAGVCVPTAVVAPARAALKGLGLGAPTVSVSGRGHCQPAPVAACNTGESRRLNQR